MTQTTIQSNFNAGELSPSMLGRVDYNKYHSGCATARNMFVNYQGGMSSRPGTAYVGMCKQAAPNVGGTATSNPPRFIPFQFSISQGFALEFGDQYMRIISDGAYVVEPAVNISSIDHDNPVNITTSSPHGYNVGDWIFISGVVGITYFNSLVWIVTAVPNSTDINVSDLFGNVINGSAFFTGSQFYISGGTLQRIYTVTAPYAAIDLPFLKFAQSANTMSICCINQETNTEYPPYELTRVGNTDWTFTVPTFGASIAAPTNATATAQSSTTKDTWYSYVVTAVSAATGEESVASNTADVQNNDISVNAGSNTVTWTPVTGASSYNIYATTPIYSTSGTDPVAIGVSYGFVGSAFGTQFVDTNIIADFTQVPPVHRNPFARGQITAVLPGSGGSGFSQATIGYSITSATGSGFAGTPIVVGGAFVGFYIKNNGQNYQIGDSITITGGTGATATLTIGPQTGTYPGCVAYFQQRRFYGFSLNQPNTYWASQTGAFENMDFSIPESDDDAITGAPWAQQVNGIQAMTSLQTGLFIQTGNGAWILNGGNNAALTPADQDATSQGVSGCHFHVTPILINYDLLYVQSKGSIVRDVSYNFFYNIYTGADKTTIANHLFNFHQIQQWGYAEEPYKIVWSVRDDGTLLALTYLKQVDAMLQPEEISAWTRNDTNGLFVSVCTVTEPPVDAVYLATQRNVNGNWVYYSERMDNRNWQSIEDCFCVDAGLSYPMSTPNAVLTPVSATGNNNITSTIVITGGQNYTNPVAAAVDSTGTGIGATFTVQFSDGVITGVTPVTKGENYTTGATTILITDPTGHGASVQPVITNEVVFNASEPVFNPAVVGNVIRIGNSDATPTDGFALIPSGSGKAVITAYNSLTQVVANIVEPITNVLNDDPNFTPLPCAPGQWTLSVPTMTVSGLNHLEGLTVTGLADGNVIDPQPVVNGSITLETPASAINVGLPFTYQLQPMYLDPAGVQPTAQTKRKGIMAVGVRVESTRGIFVGANQPDASAQPTGTNVAWTNMVEVKERDQLTPLGDPIPLYTGDYYVTIEGDWETNGQVAVQGTLPLPATILALVPYYMMGDTSG